MPLPQALLSLAIIADLFVLGNTVKIIEVFMKRSFSFRMCASVRRALFLNALLIFALCFTGCISIEARKALAPPLSVAVHIDSGSAIISGEMSTNPNAFRNYSERQPEGYITGPELDAELFVEGSEFTYSITYGSALTLFVRPANDVTDENPLVITVTEGINTKSYTVSGFQSVKVLRFSNDYVIGM